MVGVEGYHAPRNVVPIGINNADSLSQGGGERTHWTVCTGRNKRPHMLTGEIVNQGIRSTTSIDAGKTRATRGFMQGPMSSEPPIRPGPQHYHRHPVWELAIHGFQLDSKMLDVANLEGFNVRARNFKNFEPSSKHHFESRRYCGQKRIIDSFLQATFKAFPFKIPFDLNDESFGTWEILLSHVSITGMKEIRT